MIVLWLSSKFVYDCWQASYSVRPQVVVVQASTCMYKFVSMWLHCKIIMAFCSTAHCGCGKIPLKVESVYNNTCACTVVISVCIESRICRTHVHACRTLALQCCPRALWKVHNSPTRSLPCPLSPSLSFPLSPSLSTSLPPPPPFRLSLSPSPLSLSSLCFFLYPSPPPRWQRSRRLSSVVCRGTIIWTVASVLLPFTPTHSNRSPSTSWQRHRRTWDTGYTLSGTHIWSVGVRKWKGDYSRHQSDWLLHCHGVDNFHGS